MSAPLKLSALLLALAVFALPASAAGRDHDRGHRGHDRHGHYERGHDRRSAYNDGYRDGRRHDRRDDRRHRRHDRRHDRRIVFRPAPRVVYRDRYVSRPVVVHRGPPRWARGHRYYGPGYGRTYIVNDYYNYGLRRPPSGYYWRRSDAGDYLLVAIATGIIADLILSH